jgi:hypothetical protein
VGVDIDPRDNMRIVTADLTPCLDLGSRGSFDHAGTQPRAVARIGNRVFLYYNGISLRRDVPGETAIGVAVSDDDGESFERIVPGPILSAGPHDPHFVCAPAVWQREGRWMMFYVSVTWSTAGDPPEELYTLKRACSDDGIDWRRDARPAAGAKLASPCVCETAQGPRLWCCIRGPRSVRVEGAGGYRLFWAPLGADGTVGELHPVAFQNPPVSGDWDFEMQAYPYVIADGDDLVMFYNGNGFGRSGIGYARLSNGRLL